MDDMWYEAMAKHVSALEARIAVLEKRLSNPDTDEALAARLLREHPVGMTKKDAARELGVTRATVYKMIEDGRLVENGWRKVTTKSLIELIAKRATTKRKPRGRNLRMGAADDEI